jgi:hypothetical protein
VKATSTQDKPNNATDQVSVRTVARVATSEVVVCVDAVRAVAGVHAVLVARVASVVPRVRRVGRVPSRLLDLRGGVSCLYYTDPNLVPRDLSTMNIPNSLPGSL